MTILLIAAALLLLAWALQAGKRTPRKLDDIERLSRYADRIRREDHFPFD